MDFSFLKVSSAFQALPWLQITRSYIWSTRVMCQFKEFEPGLETEGWSLTNTFTSLNCQTICFALEKRKIKTSSSDHLEKSVIHPPPSLEAQLVSYEQADTKKTFTPLLQRILPRSSAPFIISALRESIWQHTYLGPCAVPQCEQPDPSREDCSVKDIVDRSLHPPMGGPAQACDVARSVDSGSSHLSQRWASWKPEFQVTSIPPVCQSKPQLLIPKWRGVNIETYNDLLVSGPTEYKHHWRAFILKYV